MRQTKKLSRPCADAVLVPRGIHLHRVGQSVGGGLCDGGVVAGAEVVRVALEIAVWCLLGPDVRQGEYRHLVVEQIVEVKTDEAR